MKFNEKTWVQLFIIFCLIALILEVFSSFPEFNTINVFLMNNETVANFDMLDTSIQFLGTILAILFTLIILPIDRIISRFSQELVIRIRDDEIFLFCLGFFVVLFLYDFFIFAFNIKTNISLLISVIGGLYIPIILLVFIYRVFDLLDLRFQLNILSKPFYENSSNDQNRNLEEEIEIIIDIILKSIEENRFEVAVHGFDEIMNIIDNYMSNIDLEADDVFITCVSDSLINSTNIISDNSHIRILDSIIDVSSVIIEKILELRNADDLSNIIFNLIKVLEIIAVGNDKFKSTPAIAEDIIDELVELGQISINQKNNLILNHIVWSIGRIGRNVS